LNAGKGFDQTPDKGLDKWLRRECKELGIEFIREKEQIEK